MRIGTVFCIDGSGNRDQKAADRKRPIYRLDCENKRISRPLLLPDESALDFFIRQIEDTAVQTPIVIAADVPLGLPADPADVLEAVGANSFLEWLDQTSIRLQSNKQSWRDGLIASGPSDRTALKPFVSIGEGDKIEGAIRAKRMCDTWTNGESVYCVDHGGKQVGRAALQFWFDVLLPMRTRLAERVAVWPFQDCAGKDVVVAECYPTECQRLVYGSTIKKQRSFEVANALAGLLRTKDVSEISTPTWIYGASSEDEFDMFTTAFAFRDSIEHSDKFFWYPPDHPDVLTIEGWMLGLKPREAVAEKKEGKERNRNVASRKRKETVWTKTGAINRNGQVNIGPSGETGIKGPLYNMKCSWCGDTYTTNAQDIFQKRCENRKCKQTKAEGANA